ncbi:glucose-1-phosphate thymidylyltransferase RfbA [Candidatus Methylopumilus planktonicus]|uniref:glucose-1-phosphate thymidylyltransferase RfbA n=1 Tax=Candidatus Methylopumilus planktonicus TaxID=1581557 RepID=UPI00112389C6|nr:glucose-1-phosphate thymidylyltransferase RfbA [Candidatus Methylopumilus planktonicus]QDD07080.1 glucose-1-phosphate thymidylyltransferase RfbA [Candidatus Methylopumilus planktonicus]QDD08416.1 glucose-1-phosphate thymidylyltransferase RfbA [Candidatus Methylopumilus planktonicus]QDD09740.1 glucose-1-phosphate thymidylyltransferase RfbA [Candidatus Methylopumilus planktonicus]
MTNNAKNRKGLILAGGLGTRLYPLTFSISKQLLPVFDKPMIYYPLSVLMLAGIRDILLISSPNDVSQYKNLLKNGNQWGINIEYCIQPSPGGLAQAFILGESFIGDNLSALILGDNIFFGHDLNQILSNAGQREDGATIFTYHVKDPQRYGIAEFDDKKSIIAIEEKPSVPKSNYAITGLYFYDRNVVELAKSLKPSKRGELEITDLNQLYLDQKKLYVELMGRGYAWLDAGTHESLLEASQFIATLENRQGLKIACPEEISFRNGWINASELEKLAELLGKNQYGQYLIRILKENII